MRIRLIGTALAIATATWSVAAASPSLPAQAPPNDDLAGAIEVAGVPFQHQGTTAGATNETGELGEDCADSQAPGVWYRLNLPLGLGALQVDTIGENEIDTVLSVWSGTAHPLEQVACSDDAFDGVWSAVELVPQPGVNYFVKVTGFTGAEGAFVLNVDAAPDAAANDDLADALVIDTLPFVHKAPLATLTNESGEVGSSCGSSEAAVWYRLEADFEARLAFHGDVSGLPPTVSIWRGSAHPLTEVACAESVHERAPLLISVIAGDVIHIRVAPVVSADELVLEFHAGPAGVAPLNDDPAGAAAIDALPFATEQTTTWATDGDGEPRASCAMGGAENGVWFRYDADSPLRLAIGTEGTNYPAIVSVWRGDPSGVFTEIDCRMDEPSPAAAIVDTVPRETLWIKVSGRSGTRGSLQLEVVDVIAPANDNLAAAQVVASLPFTHTQEVQWATAEPNELGASCHAANRNRGVWYAVPVGVGARLAVRLDSPVPSLISAWTGGPNHPLTEVGCGTSNLLIDLPPGQITYVRVEPHQRAPDLAPIEARFSLAAEPPPNDALDRPMVIPGLPYSDEQDMSGAREDQTALRGDCEPAAGPRPYALWYQYTPQVPQDVFLRAGGGDLYVSVWAAGAEPLEKVACGRQRVVASLDPGQTYVLRVAAPSSPALIATFDAIAAVRPPNDDLADATPIDTLPFTNTVTTFAATAEPDEPTSGCGGGAERGVWYRFAPDFDVALVVDTQESESGFDTTLSAWSGPAIPAYPLTLLACNDDAPGVLWSRLEHTVAAGEVVYLRAAGRGDEVGQLTLRVDVQEPPPPNDDLEGAMPIADPIGFRHEQSTQWASREPGEAFSSCNELDVEDEDRTVWFVLEPTAAISATLSTTGSDFDTVLSVWTGEFGHPLDEMTCSDDNAFDAQSTVNFEAEPGLVYYIQATGFDGDSGDLVLAGSETSAPPPEPVVYLPSAMTR